MRTVHATRPHRAVRAVVGLVAAGALLATGAFVTGASASPAPAPHPAPAGLGSRYCPPAGAAIGYSDGLDKKQVDGAEIGGLSALVWDARRGSYAAVEDHSGDQATRMWFFRDPLHPVVTGTLLLTRADRTPYTGADFDAEGLTVLPGGDYAVSSEVEPSIHIFDRSGREVGTLPVPSRFRVAPAGEGVSNATLEGLSVSPDGRYLYAAMEAALSGDVSASGDADYHRIAVYQRDRHGRYQLTRQLSYRTQPGQRISEVAAYGDDDLVVMEASYDETAGNAVDLWAVTATAHARDVSHVADLSQDPRSAVTKHEVVDVTACPSLGATAKEPQTNPLLDNFEGMALSALPAIGRGPRLAGIVLVSDDNFGDTQTTRLLQLAALLP